MANGGQRARRLRGAWDVFLEYGVNLLPVWFLAVVFVLIAVAALR